MVAISTKFVTIALVCSVCLLGYVLTSMEDGGGADG
jgi:hypothetical protein